MYLGLFCVTPKPWLGHLQTYLSRQECDQFYLTCSSGFNQVSFDLYFLLTSQFYIHCIQCVLLLNIILKGYHLQHIDQSVLVHMTGLQLLTAMLVLNIKEDEMLGTHKGINHVCFCLPRKARAQKNGIRDCQFNVSFERYPAGIWLINLTVTTL